MLNNIFELYFFFAEEVDFWGGGSLRMNMVAPRIDMVASGMFPPVRLANWSLVTANATCGEDVPEVWGIGFHLPNLLFLLTHLCPPLRSTFAVRETASLGIMGGPRVPLLNPPETIVLSEHYRL